MERFNDVIGFACFPGLPGSSVATDTESRSKKQRTAHEQKQKVNSLNHSRYVGQASLTYTLTTCHPASLAEEVTWAPLPPAFKNCTSAKDRTKTVCYNGVHTHTPHTQLTHTYSSTHNLLHPNPSPSLFSFLLSPCHLYLSFAACWKKLTCGVIWAFNFTRQGATARCGLSTAILSVIFLWPMASTLLLAECVPCWVHPVLHLVPLNPEGALCCDFARAAFLQELDYVPKLGYIGEWSSPSRMGRMGIYIPNIKIPIIG